MMREIMSPKVKTCAGLMVMGCAMALLLGCAEEPEVVADAQEAAAVDSLLAGDGAELVDGPHADHRHHQSLVLFDEASVRDYFDDRGRAVLEYPDPFQQVGFRLDAENVEEFSYRAMKADGSFGPWMPVDVYWSEGVMHNAHILLDAPTTAVEVAGLEGLSFAKIEFFDEVIARQEIVVVKPPSDQDLPDLQRQGEDEDIQAFHQALAPSSMVTSRHQWGAASPDKVCGSVVAPYRASIHHTAVPDSDGGDPHARMRGMQSYHMNTLKWCDIGYHFVVAQSGEIMQARSRTNRPAAHVGGQNHGNVGISLIGNYSSTNPPAIQVQKAGEILGWVHETHNVPLNRDAVRGHREWPGQTTGCPGNRGLAHIEEIIAIAGNGSAPEPEPEPEPEPVNYGVELEIQVEGLADFYDQGTSDGVPDGFAGDHFTAHIILTNTSEEPIRDVKLGIGFGPGVEAVSYEIQTDHPAYDRESWTRNDASDNPDNPDADEVGQEEVLIMHAFSANESKRVTLELRATDYNIGVGAHPGVRAWLSHVGELYSGASSFGDDPGTNHLGSTVREFQRVDILSRDQWQFRAGESDDLEGWAAEAGEERLLVNTNEDALAFKTNDAMAAVVSPGWTAIDADTFGQLVLRTRSHDGEHEKALYWRRDGEDFDSQRSVTFRSPGDSEFHTQVLNLKKHPEWSGEVVQLRLVNPVDLVPGEEDSGWYDLAYLYFQDLRSGATTAEDLGIAEMEPVPVSVAGQQEDDEAEEPAVDAPTAPAGPVPSPFTESGFADDGEPVQVSSGCSAAAQSPTSALMVMMVVLGLMVLRRRR